MSWCVYLSIFHSTILRFIFFVWRWARFKHYLSHLIGVSYKPFPKQQILDSSKLKEFADDNFKFDENDRKLSKCVENTLGKGEFARYEQVLLFPQCFQRTFTANT